VVPEVDERADGRAEEVSVDNARRKALAAAAATPDALVLGVDTVVTLDGILYGKPADAAHARATLRALSGREHTVTSGLCLVSSEGTRTAIEHTSVSFRPLSDELIEWYVASGEWQERAGGYAIQGRGAALVASIAGDYWNVVGLPVGALLGLEPGLLSGSERG
jgi:septum formation protein